MKLNTSQQGTIWQRVDVSQARLNFAQLEADFQVHAAQLAEPPFSSVANLWFQIMLCLLYDVSSDMFDRNAGRDGVVSHLLFALLYNCAGSGGEVALAFPQSSHLLCGCADH